MKKVYLIRHALPDFPGGKRMCIGMTDIPLGEQGFSQSAKMAARLPPVTAVFSSPLSRAVQTAQAIGMPITILGGLREMYAGEWDGLTFDEIRLKYPDLYAVVSHGSIIAQFLQKISGAWYKPDYVQIITLYYENGTFALQEEK